MKKWSKDQLITKLKSEGFHFSDFSVMNEGDYTLDDADMNYKDVPHVHHIHEVVEAIPAVMQDDLIATINMQHVFGMKFPLTLVNYESGPNEQTYFTSWLVFILIVHTHYEMISESKTRVITTYSIGSPWLFRWCHPFIRFTIRRNYHSLMRDDIPMRERRGVLRQWGYQFHKEQERHSFVNSTEIFKNNVIFPDSVAEPIIVDIQHVLATDGEYFVGRDDHLGFRLLRQGKLISIFPRICLHEGASLDKGKCINMKIACPWHGRVYQPLAIFDLENSATQTVKTARLAFKLTNKILTVNAECLVEET